MNDDDKRDMCLSIGVLQCCIIGGIPEQLRNACKIPTDAARIPVIVKTLLDGGYLAPLDHPILITDPDREPGYWQQFPAYQTTAAGVTYLRMLHAEYPGSKAPEPVMEGNAGLEAHALGSGGVRLKIGSTSFDCKNRGGELLAQAVQVAGGLFWHKMSRTVTLDDQGEAMKKNVQNALKDAPAEIKNAFVVTANGIEIRKEILYFPLRLQPPDAAIS